MYMIFFSNNLLNLSEEHNAENRQSYELFLAHFKATVYSSTHSLHGHTLGC